MSHSSYNLQDWTNLTIERTGKYIDDKLIGLMWSIILRMHRGRDFVLLIDGEVRNGKSTLAAILASWIDKTFNLNDLHLNPIEFVKGFSDVKFKAKVYDEAGGLSSKRGMSVLNVLANTIMQQMGQRNMFIILVLPNWYRLDKQFLEDRVDAICHVERVKEKDRERNYYDWYEKKGIKRLLRLFKQTGHGYHEKWAFERGKFNGKKGWPIQVPIAQYEEKKKNYLQQLIQESIEKIEIKKTNRVDKVTPVPRQLNPTPKGWLTRREVMEKVGFSDRQVFRNIENGKYDAKRINGKWYINPDTVKPKQYF